MILLSDIFRMLATGEFSTLALTRDNSGSIHEKEWRTVADHLNLGIIEIHKRFKLYTREVDLHARTDVENYELRVNRIAPTDAHLGTRQYISKPASFQGQLNLVEIMAVYNADDLEVPMNRRNHTPYVQQTSFDTLKITGLTENTVFSVVYQSYPNKIVVSSDFNLTDYVVFIPETILDPLLNFVASRVYKPTGTNDSTANADKSNAFEAKYELAMTKLGMMGLDIQDDQFDEDKFTEEGWA